MSRYAVTFTKAGYVKYTSHLDMLRLFKRATKKAGILLVYSQGYNPHPKLGFAQPLSLGYESDCEILEIETRNNYEVDEIVNGLQESMPDGIKVVDCKVIDEDVKSIASLCDYAEYIVTFPIKKDEIEASCILDKYLSQDSILAEKRQKKTKKIAVVDIKAKIRKIEILKDTTLLTLNMKLDCGSQSNLSPEQVISSLIEFGKLSCDRSEVSVRRKKLGFSKEIGF